MVKRHPGQGADLLHGVVDPEVEAMIRHHHERLGGAGYPDGLIGDAIPLGARIIAVADTFDAMTSTRAYRSARPHAVALKVLGEEAGVALDAQAVEAFKAFYSGRRGTALSSVASGLTQTFAPIRELLLPAAIGAASVLTLPGILDVQDPGSAPTTQRERAAKVERAATTARPAASTAPRRNPSRAVDGSGRRNGSSTTEKPGNRLAPGGRTPSAPRVPRPATPARPRPAATAAPPAASAQDPVTPAKSESPSPAASTAEPAPSAAPGITTPEITAPGVTVPGLSVELPELPELPVELPEIKLPPIKLP